MQGERGVDPRLAALWRGLVPAAFVAVAGLAVMAWLSLHQRSAREPLADLGALPSFSLSDQTGAAFTDALLDGKPWVADFFFSRCTGICPLLTERMKDVVRWTDEHGAAGHVGFVSFSVDPTADTSARLAAYGREHGIDAGRWHLLTGPSTAIEDVAVRGFKLAMGKPEGDPGEGRFDVLHSSRLVLVDGSRHIRGYYDGDKDGVARIEQDLARLLAEPQHRSAHQ